NAAMPRALGAIVARCLEKDPARRFASAAELRDALLALQRWPRAEGLPELARICERILVMEEGSDSWKVPRARGRDRDAASRPGSRRPFDRRARAGAERVPRAHDRSAQGQAVPLRPDLQ